MFFLLSIGQKFKFGGKHAHLPVTQNCSKIRGESGDFVIFNKLFRLI
jgi:hypothetical protein